MATQLQNAQHQDSAARAVTPARFTTAASTNISNQTATNPDQFGTVVQYARRVLAKSQSGLKSKAATNTAGNTNIMKLDKVIGDLADLVETTFDPVWKETYRIALLRNLAASEKAKGNTFDVGMDSSEISASGLAPDTFNHPAVGPVPGLDVSSWSARQAGYQQRFNPPTPAPAPPMLPVDPVAAGNRYNHLDIPGLGTTAIPTQTNNGGHFYMGPRGHKPAGTSHK